MGIFRYFYWHFTTYPDSVVPVREGQTVPGLHLFAIDLNALFHPVCQRYFFETPGQKTMEGCYREICLEIERVVAYVRPSEELILSIDGVAGLSKVNQQRQRRYKSAREKSEAVRAVFDSNHITVGTAFMAGLSAAIRTHFSSSRPYRTVFLDETMAGEGEHKIVRYLERAGKKRMCVYSPDADLLMLGIGLRRKNVFIFRPNMYQDLDCAYFMVSIDKFKRSVVKMVDPKGVYADQEEEIVDDFVFLLFFLGNDFLPHSPSYEIKYGGINTILDLYRTSVLEQKRRLVYSGSAPSGSSGSSGSDSSSPSAPRYEIDVGSLQEVLGALARAEGRMITENYKRFRGFPNRLLEKYISRLDTAFPAYRTEYYARHFPEVPVRKICEEYVRGLCFVGTYYHIGMPDWRYAYPYHHGPFFHELSEYVGTLSCARISAEFERNEPLRPLEQLLCVLPFESRAAIPKALHAYYTHPEFKDMFPKEFEIELDGCHNDYEGIVLLPPIRADAIRRAVGETEGAWTEAERRRNMHTW
jgi:5'-3' exonuclease